MTKLKHKCEECDNSFSIHYDKEESEGDLQYCPFCAEYLFIDEEKNEDDIYFITEDDEEDE